MTCTWRRGQAGCAAAGTSTRSTASPAAGRAAASVGYDLEGGQGGIGRVGDPAAVGRHLAQRS